MGAMAMPCPRDSSWVQWPYRVQQTACGCNDHVMSRRQLMGVMTMPCPVDSSWVQWPCGGPQDSLTTQLP